MRAPTVSCPASIPPWTANAQYATGAIVSYEGEIYVCLQGHTALADWSPPAAPSLWAPAQCAAGNPGGNDAGGQPVADLSSANVDSAIGGVAADMSADDGQRLAQRPYMGWSSWSKLRGGVSDAKVRAQADAMATQLLAAGYQYVNIDSGWQGGFDSNGRPRSNTKFPDMAALATYVHGRGLKLGIYLVPGLDKSVWTANSPILGTSYHAQDIVSDTTQPGNTLAGGALKIDFSKPGANEYIQSCADLVASWGVDFIKMDFVGPGGGRVQADNRADIQAWRQALDKTGRPIWLELSNSLAIADVAIWKMYANGWRITGDIENYGGTTLTTWAKVSGRFNAAAKWAQYAGPGGWNDLDSLELGAGINDGLTSDERQTTMTLWAVSAAPLSLGADLTTLDGADLVLMTNAEVIAVDQAGIAAHPLSSASNQQVWVAKNTDGSLTVALFNLDTAAATVTVHFSDLGVSGPASVRDLWTHTDLGLMTGSYGATLPAHGSELLTIAP
jgi:hypothetical protein